MFGHPATSITRRPRTAVAGAMLGVLLLSGCSGGDDAAGEPAPDCTELKDLAVLAWADGAKLIPADPSPDSWIRQHPDSADFDDVRTASGAIDVSRIWTERDRHPDPWNDLLRYYQEQGEAWLVSTHLDDIVGSRAAQQPDPVGWSACAVTG